PMRASHGSATGSVKRSAPWFASGRSRSAGADGAAAARAGPQVWSCEGSRASPLASDRGLDFSQILGYHQGPTGRFGDRRRPHRPYETGTLLRRSKSPTNLGSSRDTTPTHSVRLGLSARN